MWIHSLTICENFGETNFTQFSTVPFRIGYQQELLGFNAFRWDRKIEPLKFDKVKKQYLYNAESVSEEAVNYFFCSCYAQPTMNWHKIMWRLLIHCMQ